MTNLSTIDDQFVDDYIFNHRNKLGKPTMGGTDWRFADIVAPSFREILEIAQPKSILELGFNAGASALMFLSINRLLEYHSVDISENEKSEQYLEKEFSYFWFYKRNSKDIVPRQMMLLEHYDLIFIDGEHTREGVVSDIEVSLKFNPQYLLFDDWYHPSHRHISEIVTEKYKDILTVVKIWEFNQCWSGYSMALCKVKKQSQ